MSSSSTDVLIVGAGPTGLMLACQLSHYPNVSFRIIDKNSARVTQSRALVIHARSLELFSQLNLAEKIISKGKLADGMQGYFQGKLRLKIDFTKIQFESNPQLTKYPYLLLLEQSITEDILETYLNERNIKVERQTEAIDFIDINSTDNYKVEVKLSTGERIRTKYVCGCDGARSVVRHILNLNFTGRTYSESLFVADCKVLNSPINENEAAIFFEATGMAGMFPMSNNQYRLLGTIHHETQNETNFNFDDAVKLFKIRTRNPNIGLYDCSWLSIYRSHHRHIKTFRYRNQYFLLGDAAHIHSPLGGQGMNTGLQDAHNLAWKLAYVLTFSANDCLLDTYHNERSIVAEKLVNSTDRMFSFFSNPNRFVSFLRLYVLPYFLQFIIQPILNYSKTLQTNLFKRLSQLGISYRSSINGHSYNLSSGKFHQHTPLPGDRFPYIIFDPCFYHFIIFDNEQISNINEFTTLIKSKYSKIIQIHYSHEENLPVQFEGAMLIRPDGYIAYRTTTFDIQHFRSYFRQFFSDEVF